MHQIRFFDYTPTPIHCISYDELYKKLAVSRSDGSIEIWSIIDDWYQERVSISVLSIEKRFNEDFFIELLHFHLKNDFQSF